MSSPSKNGYEPKIVSFLCRWCSYAGADLAGVSRLEYPPNAVSMRVNCSGRVNPEMVVSAFEKGADGVLIGGCHPGDCHYVNGNYKTRRRILLLKRVLGQMGLDPRRVRLEWISASEGAKFQQTMQEFVETIKELGPSPMKTSTRNEDASVEVS